MAEREARLKILVVDDHPLIRQALPGVLRQLDDAGLVLDAPDWPSAGKVLAEHPDLDLILLDLHLPGISGLEALSELRDSHAGIPVVALSAADDRQTVLEAIDRGAAGFIPKSSSNEVLVNALRLVLCGGVYLPPEILEHARSTAPGPAQARPAAQMRAELGLTERQLEVLALIVQGKSNKVIGRQLDLAEATVKIHVSAILKAFKVTSRTQALIAATRLGLRFD
ncbi:response regulator [Sulfurifustis variabilis]|uniref:response regulator n=1 Tax=Sulfurifustis variabilis TaxID=1675686 RepID=UPI0018D577FC|nr:response regulator transcription factor [Sulfurifustis variabilis]